MDPEPAKPDDPAEPHPPAVGDVERVFFEVAALAPVDRDAAIARLCGTDAALEADVRSMLAWAARVGAFLEKPALGTDVSHLAPGPAEPPDDLPGTTLGRFRVLSRIAAGGMGVVYLGERADGQFEQRVAIKVVKRGMDSEEIVRRFHSERQTLAALNHTAIARLIDGGMTPDGRPFLVMEHVDGVPIDQYCDAQRLRVPERLTLFRQVCEAVHHAHQNLVIHRDLKPSNILVTPAGQPKLLDFGIAKLLTGSATDQPVTLDTDRRLTPEYASPEQVQNLPVTTASDVYSLGVVLYELLSGTRPYAFTDRSSDELRRLVCETEPPPPSAAVGAREPRMRATTRVAQGTEPAPATDRTPATRGVTATRLRSALRGDLDTIVMHALRKEPRRRYASAEQFAADLDRYQRGLPVQARRDTWAYRASKFLRRHALGTAAAVLAFALLSGATVLLTRQRNELALQRDQLVTANRGLDEARRYLVRIISSGETGNHGPDAKLGEVLREAIDTLAQTPPTDPFTRASAEHALGRAVLSVGQLASARTLLERSLAGYQSTSGSAEQQFECRLALAELLFFEGKHASAEAEFRTLLAEHRAAASPAVPSREGDLLNDLGASLRLQGRAEESIAVQREALEFRRKLSGERSLDVAESHNNLGSSLFQSGAIDEAIEHMQACVDIRRALLRPDHPLILRAGSNLGLALLRKGDVDAAAALLQTSAEAWPRAFGNDHPGRAPAVISWAKALRRQGKPAEAVGVLQSLLDWQTGREPEGSVALASTRAHIGEALIEQQDDARARVHLEQAVPILLKSGQSASVIRTSATTALAGLYDRLGEADKAKSLRDALR